jgi:hypothetical protein
VTTPRTALNEVLAAGGFPPAAASCVHLMPVSAIDYVSGYLMAFGAMVALARRAKQGGSWVGTSLTGPHRPLDHSSRSYGSNGVGGGSE